MRIKLNKHFKNRTIVYVLLLTVFAFSTKSEKYDSGGWTINWEGVKGNFRFDTYCSPKEGIIWSLWGGGKVTFQSLENGVYQVRENILPFDGSEIDFNGCWFDVNGNGWVVGDKGTIIQTADNGLSWKQQISKTTKRLKAITCIDAKNCWALGNDDILRTKDGGKNWENYENVLEDVTADLIDFVNKKDGWAVDTGSDALYRTKDGGKTWKLLMDEKTDDGIFDSLFYGIKFIDSKFGWAAGRSKIGYTIDGGETWKISEINEGVHNYQYFVGIVALDKKKALVVNKGEYNYCTEDGGKIWVKCFRRKDIEDKSN